MFSDSPTLSPIFPPVCHNYSYITLIRHGAFLTRGGRLYWTTDSDPSPAHSSQAGSYLPRAAIRLRGFGGFRACVKSGLSLSLEPQQMTSSITHTLEHFVIKGGKVLISFIRNRMIRYNKLRIIFRQDYEPIPSIDHVCHVMFTWAEKKRVSHYCLPNWDDELSAIKRQSSTVDTTNSRSTRHWSNNSHPPKHL